MFLNTFRVIDPFEKSNEGRELLPTSNAHLCIFSLLNIRLPTIPKGSQIQIKSSYCNAMLLFSFTDDKTEVQSC